MTTVLNLVTTPHSPQSSDHSPQSSAVVKNVWSYTLTPLLAFMVKASTRAIYVPICLTTCNRTHNRSATEAIHRRLIQSRRVDYQVCESLSKTGRTLPPTVFYLVALARLCNYNFPVCTLTPVLAMLRDTSVLSPCL